MKRTGREERRMGKGSRADQEPSLRTCQHVKVPGVFRSPIDWGRGSRWTCVVPGEVGGRSQMPVLGLP